jgi:hypothetical protein
VDSFIRYLLETQIDCFQGFAYLSTIKYRQISQKLLGNFEKKPGFLLAFVDNVIVCMGWAAN